MFPSLFKSYTVYKLTIWIQLRLHINKKGIWSSAAINRKWPEYFYSYGGKEHLIKWPFLSLLNWKDILTGYISSPLVGRAVKNQQNRERKMLCGSFAVPHNRLFTFELWYHDKWICHFKRKWLQLVRRIYMLSWLNKRWIKIDDQDQLNHEIWKQRHVYKNQI
jgi:hypothetical protein